MGKSISFFDNIPRSKEFFAIKVVELPTLCFKQHILQRKLPTENQSLKRGAKKGMLHLFRAKANIDLYENIGPFFLTFYINSASMESTDRASVFVVYLTIEDKTLMKTWLFEHSY